MKHEIFNTIHRKTAALVAISALCLAIVIGVLTQFILLNGFTQLENKQTMSDLNVALENLHTEIHRLDSVVGDWAIWDDTYYFLLGENPGYIKDNLTDESVSNLNINLFVIVDQRGKIVYQKGFDTNVNTYSEIPFGFQNYLYQHPSLYAVTGETEALSGLISVDGQPIVIASQSITKNDFSGPSSGTLIIGRNIDLSELNMINPAPNISVDIRSVENLVPGSDFHTAYTTVLQSNQSVIRPISNTVVEGYSLYNDIYGEPTFIFQISGPREIYQHGLKNLTLFVAAASLFGVLFGFIFINSFDRIVLARLRTITRTVSQIKSTSDLSMRVRVWGKDELATLARQINETFEALNIATKKLEENQARLEYEAYHDALTGFPNRAYFVSRLNQAMRSPAKPEGAVSAVLFLDLDRFKLVNDSYDHEFGDLLLVELSRRLARCVRNSDFISRFGGDEFVILLEYIHNEADAIDVADRIKRELSVPFFIRGKSIFITASIGITFTDAKDRPEDALRNADIAMYRAKAQGKARYAIFDNELRNSTFSRLEMENELRHGLSHGELEVYYQPILSLANQQVTAVEALVRWHHPTRGMLSPGEFLSTAEETGLIIPLSELVTVTALKHLKQLHEKGFWHISMSINFSYPLLREPYLVDWLTQQIAETQVNPQSVHVELTENAVITDFNAMLETLHKLKSIGLKLALDDFGTGYSSLVQVKKIPADCLKIDRAFMGGVLQPGGDQAVVTSIIHMAQQMGMVTIAEGVETREQMRFLGEHGCNYAQGYYFARPMAFSALLNYLKLPVEISR